MSCYLVLTSNFEWARGASIVEAKKKAHCKRGVKYVALLWMYR
jgi:hypothetical protein